MDAIKQTNNRIVKNIYNRKKEFEIKGFTDKWRKGELSNYEYLMVINTYSGRSFNDISQYPVFPWVLKDYETSTILITYNNINQTSN